MRKEGNESRSLPVWLQRFQAFFLKPAQGRPLAALRIGLSVILLIQAYYLFGARHDFYAPDGIVQQSAAYDLGLSLIPNIEWLMNQVGGASLSPRFAVDLIIATYVFSLVFLGLGLFTPLASIAVWFLHWVLNNSSLHTRYGIDIYAHIFLFYLMFCPCGKYWSMDALFRKAAPQPTGRERLVLRIMQLHLCVSYFATGLLKAQGEQWWNGELIWRALTLPIYRQWDMTWLGQWPFLLMFAGWMTLVFEMGYGVFIWPRRTRWIWIMGMFGLHLGIAVFLGLHLFGFIMCVMTFSLFALSAEPGEFWAYSTIPAHAGSRDLVIFDGDCTLCNRWVRFVRERDPDGRFIFIPRSSVQAQKIFAHFGRENVVESSTIFLVQDYTLYERSSAILRVCRRIEGPWSALFLLLLVPRRLRDLVYKMVARYRYELFGVSVCPVQVSGCSIEAEEKSLDKHSNFQERPYRVEGMKLTSQLVKQNSRTRNRT